MIEHLKHFNLAMHLGEVRITSEDSHSSSASIIWVCFHFSTGEIQKKPSGHYLLAIEN
jgi:hypothetical protein